MFVINGFLMLKEGLEKVLRKVTPVAKFFVPDWGDIVDSGIGLSYQLARIHRLAARNDNPMPESTLTLCQSRL